MSQAKQTWDRDGIALYLGDCLDILPQLPPDRFEAIVTDPPYGLEFMGKQWDRLWRRAGKETIRSYGRTAPMFKADTPRYQAGAEAQEWHRTWAVAALAALAPRGRLLAFGGTRVHHRLWCAIEDAGFDITDTLMWLHGQGFPKGKSCLKPAWEPIALARKGKAAPLNIDKCRIHVSPEDGGGFRSGDYSHRNDSRSSYDFMENGQPYRKDQHPSGRWPANLCLSHHPECRQVGTKRVATGTAVGENASPGRVYGGGKGLVSQGKGTNVEGYADAEGKETVEAWECHPECPVRILDQQSGERSDPHRVEVVKKSIWGGSQMQFTGVRGFGDTGGASRFFYCPKASRAERGEGNGHPTVKPLALIRWLVELVTPSGGTVLDPFLGSGTTAVASVETGRPFVGIEIDPHYFEIAVKRIERALAEKAELLPFKEPE